MSTITYEVHVANTTLVEEFTPIPLGGRTHNTLEVAQTEFAEVKQTLMEKGFISATWESNSGDDKEETAITMVTLYKRTATTFEALDEYDSKGFPAIKEN